jgi:hypothetical protein
MFLVCTVNIVMKLTVLWACKHCNYMLGPTKMENFLTKQVTGGHFSQT